MCSVGSFTVCVPFWPAHLFEVDQAITLDRDKITQRSGVYHTLLQRGAKGG